MHGYGWQSGSNIRTQLRARYGTDAQPAALPCHARQHERMVHAFEPAAQDLQGYGSDGGALRTTSDDDRGLMRPSLLHVLALPRLGATLDLRVRVKRNHPATS